MLIYGWIVSYTEKEAYESLIRWYLHQHSTPARGGYYSAEGKVGYLLILYSDSKLLGGKIWEEDLSLGPSFPALWSENINEWTEASVQEKRMDVMFSSQEIN